MSSREPLNTPEEEEGENGGTIEMIVDSSIKPDIEADNNNSNHSNNNMTNNNGYSRADNDFDKNDTEISTQDVDVDIDASVTVPTASSSVIRIDEISEGNDDGQQPVPLWRRIAQLLSVLCPRRACQCNCKYLLVGCMFWW